MRLSELKTGESATILKVLGHGGFRRRIMEMGFVRGQRVEVILNAPLKDPIQYRIMGYDISLRRSEAEMIEVLSDSEADELLTPAQNPVCESHGDNGRSVDDVVHSRSHTISVALVGNPNSGKTSLFNAISGGHEHVGNYSGVTVDAKTGTFRHGGYTFNIIDLPGTYSLSAYSPEELYVRRYLRDNNPDVIVNVVDGSNLERNLYLTTQLMELGIPVVVAVNMLDLAEKNGDKLDLKSLSKELGCPVVGITALKNKGVDEAVSAVLTAADGPAPQNYRTFTVEESALEDGDDVESATAAARYDFIGKVVSKSVKKGRAAHALSTSDKIDRVVTNRILALPIFVCVMFLVYAISMGGWGRFHRHPGH